jgi:hypothetical protein
MRNIIAKKLRQNVRREQSRIVDSFSTFVNELPFRKRIKLAIKILLKRF